MASNLFTVIHTDGGAAPNPGEGAYVAILQNGERTACVRGYAPYATNQQMELAAAIAGLQALKSTKIPVHLYTDSQYLQAGASMWLKGWRKNGWKTSEDKPLANVELWQALDQVMNKFVITWFKVEGHAGIEMNVKADSLVWDTRNAKGDPALYQVTDIPAVPCLWDYNQFKHQVNHTIRPDEVARRGQVALLRDEFSHLLKGPKS
jgi:ribonuclease HI